VTNPGAYTAEAVEAWKETLVERKLDTQALLTNLRASQVNERETARIQQQYRDTRSKNFTRRLGRFFGFLGIPLSIAIGGISLAQSHFGGLVASAAWLGCSVWLAFYYKGD
jgi:hypothetical protein